MDFIGYMISDLNGLEALAALFGLACAFLSVGGLIVLHTYFILRFVLLKLGFFSDKAVQRTWNTRRRSSIRWKNSY